MKNNNKILSMLLLIILCISLTGCGKSSKIKNNTTAVSLKNTKITANEFYKELKKDSIEKLINMIDHKLFDKKYPSNEEENSSIETQIESIKSYYKDDENSYLSAIKSYFGVKSEDELREMLSLQFKRNKAVTDYLKNNITDAEIQKYYDENIYGDIKASHILISVKTKDDASDEEKDKAKQKALEKAKKVIKELDEGKKFKDLAKKYSDDDATKDKGGDLGYFNKDDMDGGFWNGALELEKGKYSKEPVESSYGYHIILKKDTKEKKSLKSVKTTIKEKLTEDQLNSDKVLYYNTLIKIREEKNIKFNDSDLEKQYKKYNNKLIENANNSSNSEQKQK